MKNITTEIEYANDTAFNMTTERFERQWWILVKVESTIYDCMPQFSKPTSKQVRKFKNAVIKRNKRWDKILNKMNKELY